MFTRSPQPALQRSSDLATTFFPSVAPSATGGARSRLRHWLALPQRTALTRLLLLGLALGVMLGVVLGPLAAAQTAQFGDSESTLPVTPAATLQPASVVVDGSGDVYVSDFGNDQVVELTPTTGGYTQTVVANSSTGGLVSPRGLTLDASGNLYIADYGGDQILKVACASTCGTPSALVTGLSSGPQDVAFNPNGYIWFTMWGDANVWHVSTSGGAAAKTVLPSAAFSQPSGLAVQTTGAGPWTGNLFVSDYNNDNVAEWTWNGSAWTSDGTVPTGSLTNPTRMAVDGAGSLYIADTGDNRVVKVPWTGSSWGTPVTVLTSTLNQPVGVTVDSTGNIYIADWENHRVLKESTGAVNFGSVAVRTTSSPLTLNFIFTGAGTLGSTAVFTEGALGLDFADAGTGTCAAGHDYNQGDVCGLSATFKPLYSGVRLGAAVLKDTGGNVIATAYLYGTGSGPQIAFVPTNYTGAPLTESTLAGVGASGGPSSDAPNGIAVDAAGDVFISDTANGQVVKLTPSGYTQTVVSTGFLYPNGVAVDGAGNVYVADSGCQLTQPSCQAAGPSGQLYKIPWNGSAYGTPQPLLTASTHAPAGVAVDASGDVFFTEGLASQSPYVGEISVRGGLTQLTQFSGLTLPSGLAFDASGNLFVSDSGGAAVWELEWTGNGWNASATKVISIPDSGSNPSVPSGLALDASEDLYVADYNLHHVYKYPWTGSSWGSETTVATSALDTTAGVALDGGGNLYVTECNCDAYSHSRAFKEDYANAPSLSFANTAYGATSSDSPQTIAIENIGNANLDSEGGAPAIPPDFDLSSSTCAALEGSGTLTPAQSCNLVASFIPWHVGNLGESLALTNNNLNAAGPGYATQTIQFSGTATAGPLAKLVVSAPGSTTAGSPFGVTVTAEDQYGNVETTDNGTVSLSSTDPQFSGTGGALTNGVGTFSVILATAGTQTISATDGTHPGTSGAITVSASAAAIATPIGTPQTVFVNMAFTTPLTVTVTDLYTNPIAGLTVKFTAPGSGASVTLSATKCVTLANGSCSVTATGNATTGSYNVKASVLTTSLKAYFALTNNAIPNLVVTSTLDDSGSASNCTAQSSTTSGTDNSCSLRDALLEAGTLGAANIYFDTSKFATAKTITLTSGGTLTIPANTAIQGLTSGSGATLANLVTVAGAVSFPVFTVASGTPDVAIGNLTITGGNSNQQFTFNSQTEYVTAGGIYNQGTLTVSNSTFANNPGGGITNVSPGNLTVVRSTFNSNSTGGQAFGGGISNMNAGAVANILYSTLYNNRGEFGGGLGIAGGTVSVTGSTFYFNQGGQAGGIAAGPLYGSGTLTVANSLIDGNVMPGGSGQYPDFFVISGQINGNSIIYTDGGGNLINTTSTTNINDPTLFVHPYEQYAVPGNYGGPTQTLMPQPGNPGLCTGLAANVPAGSTTDQRGYPNTNTTYPGYSARKPCVDAGAVQTNYAISFTTEPPAITPTNTLVLPSGVQFPVTMLVTESGQPIGGVTPTLTLNGAGTLGGISPMPPTLPDGTLPLYVSVTETPGTWAPGLTITAGAATPAGFGAKTTSFNVSPVTHLVFNPPPNANILAGGNAGNIVVDEDLTDYSYLNNTIDLLAADTIQLVVTGPGGYSQTYTQTATSGVATFNLSTLPLSAAGSYTYTATATGAGNTGIPALTATETVYNPYVNPFLGDHAVGTPSGPQPVTIVITHSGTLAANGIHVFTLGSPNQDFTFVSGGTCTASTSYTVGQACAVDVNFTPLYPGERFGAVVLVDGSGNILGEVYIDPVGLGPQIVFEPGVESTLPLTGTATPLPYALAVDGAGDVFISDGANEQVVKETPSGSSYTQSTVATGLVGVRGVAVDGAGNVYIADYSGKQLYEAPWNGISYGALVPLLTPGTYSPAGLVVDSLGNVYFTNFTGSDGNVYEISGGSVTTLPNVTGLTQALGLAFDANGDLFISDYSGNKVVELPWTGIAWGTQIPAITTGLVNPARIAVDAADNIYVANSGANSVVRAPYTGSNTWGSLITEQTSTLNGPQAVALDSAGNLYIADSGNHRVLKEDRADPPSLSFNSTPATWPSSDSPKTVEAENIGNQNLNFTLTPDPNYPPDFPENALDTSLCAAGTPLAPGATCDLSMSFIPTSVGTFNENLVLTDNNLDATGPGWAVQNIPLIGTGLEQPTALVAPSSANFSATVDGTTANAWTFTLNNESNTNLIGISMIFTGANPSNFAISGSSCGTTLAPYSTCTFEVTFTPSISGNPSDYYSANLVVNDDAVGHPQIVSLTGTGLGLNVLLNPNPVNFGTETAGGTSPTQTAILANANSGTLTITSIGISGSGASAFNIVGTTCGPLPIPGGGITLGQNQSCTITMNFSPSSNAYYSATLTVTDNGQGGQQSVTLNGQGQGQSVLLAPTTINFSSQTVYSTSNAWTVTFNNTSNLPVTGVGVSIVGANPNDFGETTDCGSTLAANSTCHIYVTFTPQSANYFTGTLQVVSSAGTQTASLTGTGTAATATLAPDQLNFGSVPQYTTSPSQPATFTNDSDGPITITGISITSDSTEFAISSNGCTSPLVAHATCQIYVTYKPQYVGNSTGTLSVYDSATGSPQTVSLVGVGTSTSVAGFLSPGSINFGTQTVGSTSNTWAMTLNDTSSTAMTGLSIYIGGGNPGDFNETNSCGNSLGANSTCTIWLTFKPTLTGSRSATLYATYTSGSGGSFTAGLTGTGVAPSVALSPYSLNFGNQTEYLASSPQQATLTNSSAGPISIYSIYISSGAPIFFTPSNTCGTSLAGYSSCTIDVAFTPTSATSYSGTLLISDSASGGQQTVGLSGTGTSNTPTGYFSPSSIGFGNQTVGSTSNAWGVTLNNSSSIAMSGLALGVGGSNPGDFHIIDSSCGGTLAGNSTCSFQVTFAPTALNYRSGTLMASFTSGSGGSITAPLTGYGIAPTVSVSPGSINFGNLAFGSQSSDGYVTLANTSAGILTGISYNSGGSPFFIDPGATNCTTTLAAYTSCTIAVYFKPYSPTGFNGTLTIYDSASGGEQTVGLSGSGQLASQFITFPQPTSPVLYPGTTSATLTATASSGLPITYTVLSGPATVTGSTLTYTGAGTVVVQAAQPGDADYTAAAPMTQSITVATTSYYAPTGLVGTSSSSQTAIVFLPSGFTLGSISVVTEGTTGLDFQPAGGTCAVTTTYTTGEACTVNYTFKPLAPGLRMGAIELYDNSPTPVLEATVFLSGVGTSPQIVFEPGLESALPLTGSATPAPYALAVDAAGDVFISDGANERVVKETPSGISYTQSTVASGLVGVRGVAVDGAGNVYIADYSGKQLYEVPWNGSSYGASVPLLPSGTYSPANVAVDGLGNVYFTSFTGSNGHVYEITGGSVTTLPNVTGLTQAMGLAFDASGDLFISDYSGNKVVELPWTGSAWGTQITAIATGLLNPARIAVDAAENIYVANSGANRVVRAPYTGSNTWGSLIIEQTSTLNSPQAVALDSAGNLYIADSGNHRVLKEDRANPPSLSFASTAYGIASSDSPKTVTIANIGNANLVSSGGTPAIPPDFDLSASTCAALEGSGTLTPAQSCNLVTRFIPAHVGSLSESLTLADNNLNVFGVTQIIPFTGTAVQATPAVTVWPTASSISSGEPLSDSTLSGGTSSVPGTFVWTTPGTAPPFGTENENVTFLPTDSTDYVPVAGIVSVTVTAPAPLVITSTHFNLAANPNTLTLQAGQSGTVNMTLEPLGGYTGTVALSCSGLPSGVSCSFAPANLTADGKGTPKTSTLTISTTGLSASLPASGRGGKSLAGIMLLPGFFCGLLLAWRRRKLSGWAKQLLVLAVLTSTLAGFTGCGGAAFSGALTGAHSITVKAQATAAASGAGATTQTGTLTLNITQ